MALLGALVVIGLVLALAPRTSLGAQIYNELPVFSAVRTVNRFLALSVFVVPLLASIGLRQFPKKARGLLVALLFLELLPAPFPAQEATIPSFYATLAEGPAGSLLEIPATTDYLVASRAQYASTVHGRAILASNAFERVQPREEREALLRTPVLGALLTVRPDNLERPTLFGQTPTEIAVAALASENVIAVIVHERVLGFPTLRFGAEGPVAATPEDFHVLHRTLRTGGLRKERAGDDMTLYRVPPWPDARSAVVAIPETGWTRVPEDPRGPRRVQIQPGAVFSVRVLGNVSVPVTLTFHVREQGAPLVHLWSSAGSRPGIVSPNGAVSIVLGTLTPGSHTFSLSVDGSPIVVENLSVRNGPS